MPLPEPPILPSFTIPKRESSELTLEETKELQEVFTKTSELLKDSSGFIKQIEYTLVLTSSMYLNNLKLQGAYEVALNSYQDANEQSQAVLKLMQSNYLEFITKSNELLAFNKSLKNAMQEVLNEVRTTSFTITNSINEALQISQNMQEKLIELNSIYMEIKHLFAQKDEIAVKFDEMQDFNRQIEATLQQAQELLTQARDEITTLKTESKLELRDLVGELQTELLNAKTEHLTELETFRGTKITQIEDKTNQNLAQIEALKTTKENELISIQGNLKNELKATKDDFLTQISIDYMGEVAKLKSLFYEIALHNQSHGAEYQTETFNANGVWNKPSGVSGIYVFIRGGSGHANSQQSGDASSFGEFLSANGGAGNTNTNGQKGETLGQFLLLNEDITSVNVSVGEGGIVIVSHPKASEFTPDLDFINEADLIALGADTNNDNHISTQEKEAFFAQNITNRALENKYRNILTLEVDTSKISDVELINLSKSRRQVELECAKEFILNNIPINETLDLIKASAENPPELPEPQEPTQEPQEPQVELDLSHSILNDFELEQMDIEFNKIDEDIRPRKNPFADRETFNNFLEDLKITKSQEEIIEYMKVKKLLISPELLGADYLANFISEEELLKIDNYLASQPNNPPNTFRNLEEMVKALAFAPDDFKNLSEVKNALEYTKSETLRVIDQLTQGN